MPPDEWLSLPVAALGKPTTGVRMAAICAMGTAMQPLDHLSLHLFIVVCEAGTIARASERAFMAPSAVSKRISDIEARFSPDVVRGVAEGSADLGICRTSMAVGDLEFVPYRQDHLAVVVGADHPLAGRGSIAFEE